MSKVTVEIVIETDHDLHDPAIQIDVERVIKGYPPLATDFGPAAFLEVTVKEVS